MPKGNTIHLGNYYFKNKANYIFTHKGFSNNKSSLREIPKNSFLSEGKSCKNWNVKRKSRQKMQ